jgi:bifunctional non-homologous end joining protein LigD
MRPRLVREPFHRPGWIYEEKYDGWRMLAFKNGDTVRLVSRNGVDHTRRFPNIVGVLHRIRANRLVLDGEVCSFDENLVSQFQYLPASPPEVHATPPVFMVFDCLHDTQRDLRAEPLATRRAALERAVEGARLIFPARRLGSHGLDAWGIVKERGYEGLVAKDERSPYRGGPTRSWVKVKIRHEGKFVVCAILGSPEAPEGLLVGERAGRQFVYRGAVKWGVRRDVVAAILQRTDIARRSPFGHGADGRRATWLKPTVNVELTYNELMEGRLRDAVFRTFAPNGRDS